MTERKLYHEDYVKNYTNASFIVKDVFNFTDGVFSGYNKANRTYDISSWGYETEGDPLTGGPTGTPRP